MSHPVPSLAHMEVQVKRSARRHKTVQARIVDGVLEVSIPGDMTKAEERHWVEIMEARFRRRQAADSIDLPERARVLAAMHDLPAPADIVWSERQKTLWGSCTPSQGRVRIATRVSGFPSWVIDYVIVHELAHLAIADHSVAFWELVNRYRYTERARGYLEAKSEAR